jgi:hypothetical protein
MLHLQSKVFGFEIYTHLRLVPELIIERTIPPTSMLIHAGMLKYRQNIVLI